MYLQDLVIFSLALVRTSLCYDDIHTFMSERQIREVFQAETYSVQEHELVNVRFPEPSTTTQLSNGTHMTVEAFGNEINLWLYPSNSILFDDSTPVYIATSAPDRPSKVKFTLRNDLMNGLGQLLEDPVQLASVVIRASHVHRKRSVNGLIGSKRLAIRSLPQSVVRKYLRERRSIDDIDDSSNYHVAYMINEDAEKYHSGSVHDERMIVKRDVKSTPTLPPPHQIPLTLYPEILVVVEYTIYRAQGSPINGLLEYLLAFWNSVDLKYRGIKDPSVRLHISALVLGSEPEATPYIWENIENGTILRTLDALKAGTRFLGGIKDTFPSVSYDVAVTLTRRNMNDVKMGMAWHEGACLVHNVYNKSFKGVLVHDNGGFEGVHIAAHEIGHTFGMHDDGIPGEALECDYDDGFVMAAYVTYTKNTSMFSQCSLNHFQETLDKQYLTCLYNVPPRLGKDMPKLLPGKIMSLDEQCKVHKHDPRAVACKPGLPEIMDVCVHYYCKIGSSCHNTYVGAADGTPCEDVNDSRPGICLHSKCAHY